MDRLLLDANVLYSAAYMEFAGLAWLWSLDDAPQRLKLPESIRLEPKDRSILLTAIHRKADFLLTGNARHFGHP